MTDDDLYECAEEYYSSEFDFFDSFDALVRTLQIEGFSEERLRVLLHARLCFSDLLNDSVVGFVARSRLQQARRVGVSTGTSREKVREVLEVIGAPTRAKTVNRQLLEWWDQLSRMATEHPGVLADPLEIAPADSEFVFPPGEGYFYADQEIRLGFEGWPLDHFEVLTKIFGISDEALLQRLDRAAKEAQRDGDPLGDTWIPKLDAVLSSSPSREDSFPPAVLAAARVHSMSKVDHS